MMTHALRRDHWGQLAGSPSPSLPGTGPTLLVQEATRNMFMRVSLVSLAAEVLGRRQRRTRSTPPSARSDSAWTGCALARLRELADQGDFDEFIGNKAAYRR
jgi:hypothetical protein